MGFTIRAGILWENDCFSIKKSPVINRGFDYNKKKFYQKAVESVVVTLTEEDGE